MVSFLNCLAIRLPQYVNFVNFWNPNNSHTRLANLCKYIDGHDYNNLETWNLKPWICSNCRQRRLSIRNCVFLLLPEPDKQVVKGFSWSVVGRKIMLSWFLIALKFSPRFVVRQKCSRFLIKLYNRNPLQYNQSKLKAWFTIRALLYHSRWKFQSVLVVFKQKVVHRNRVLKLSGTVRSSKQQI